MAHTQKKFEQVIKLANNGNQFWPDDTRMVLNENMTDVKIAKKIFIGQVPKDAQVEIKIAIDASKSAKNRHAFSYTLLYGADYTKQIGQPINLCFKIQAILSDNKSVSTAD